MINMLEFYQPECPYSATYVTSYHDLWEAAQTVLTSCMRAQGALGWASVGKWNFGNLVTSINGESLLMKPLPCGCRSKRRHWHIHLVFGLCYE